jgi:hypothetical protein
MTCVTSGIAPLGINASAAKDSAPGDHIAGERRAYAAAHCEPTDDRGLRHERQYVRGEIDTRKEAPRVLQDFRKQFPHSAPARCTSAPKICVTTMNPMMASR